MQPTPHSSDAARPGNRLAREKSPYLLQHAHNPVDWFPWGTEAFEKARRENKPIFLSIGYSTCHWCHVMERESFVNASVAAFLNEHFVSIKLDREERPDVDRIYMTFVQATTGAGGWPMSVFLGPDLKPFFGGTYFPPDSRQGRPGFLQLLRHIAALWSDRPDDIRRSADQIHAQLSEALGRSGSEPGHSIQPEWIERSGQLLKRIYDPASGGFGGAPKFPQPSQPLLLLRYAARFGDTEAVRMADHMARRMAAGGIHDQLGGGFARYAVDAEWRVPHFEKMLYDNAQLAVLYLELFLVTGDEAHAATARDILDYVLRDMTHPDGGFYSAEDADSEGHEGKFYTWTEAELKSLLTPGEWTVVQRRFAITAEGNFIDHSHPEPLQGQNVLNIADPVLSDAELPILESALSKMRVVRSRRVRPHLDDKILTSWNGLMIAALARAAAVLGDPRYREAAQRAAAFIRKNLWHDGDPASPRSRDREIAVPRLFHRWRDGERDNTQLLEDYAGLLHGLVELYEAAPEPGTLEFAVAVAEALLHRFHDAANGGFWQSPDTASDLILRTKEEHDGAEPAGSSVAAVALLRLGAITGRTDFTAAAVGTLKASADRLSESPLALPWMLQAVDFALQEPRRVVIGGKSADSERLLRAAHSVFQPSKVVLGTAGPVEEFARTLAGREGAFICLGTACQEPTSDPARIRELLTGG
ncbi:MAG: thioredoxin domain-containing protein [Verrucomicrobiota bacterium]